VEPTQQSPQYFQQALVELVLTATENIRCVAVTPLLQHCNTTTTTPL
jgi:hypothetical protein